MVPTTILGQLDAVAAQLTAAMLRYDIERLPRNTVAFPPEAPGQLGEVAFVFLMRQEVVRDAELVTYLGRLLKPVILAPLAQKGLIGAWWPEALDDRARRGWDHTLENQRRAIEAYASDLRWRDDELALLETTKETLFISLAALRRWGDTYGVNIGWSLSDNQGDPRARVRLNLIRGDGSATPGRSCQL